MWLVISYGVNEWRVIEEEDLMSGPACLDCEVTWDNGGVETDGMIRDTSNTKKGAEQAMEKMKDEVEAEGNDDGMSKRRKRRRNSPVMTSRGGTPSSSRGNTPFPTRGGSSLQSQSPSRKTTKTSSILPPPSPTLVSALTTPNKSAMGFLAAAAPTPTSATGTAMAGGATPTLRHTAPAKRRDASAHALPTAALQQLGSSQDPLVNHLLTVVTTLSSEVTTLKNLMMNQFQAWNALIVSTANRAESAAKETEGHKERMGRIESALATVKDGMDELLSTREEKVFDYAPYLTLKDVDAVDRGQGAGNLATDLEDIVYDPTDPDLKLSFKEKKDKSKRDHIMMCVLHRRKAFVGLARTDAQKQIVLRINEYARKRKAGIIGVGAKQKADTGNKGSKKGEGGKAKRVKVEMREEDEEEDGDEGESSSE